MQPDCISALCRDPAAGKHVFIDIFHRLANLQHIDNPYSVLRSMPNAAAALLISRSPLSRTQLCAAHNAHCEVPRCDVDMTGTPCQDYSRAGSRHGLIAGTRFAVIWSWMHIMLTVQPPVIIHENVVGFPENIIQHLFQELYSIHAVCVC